MPLSQEAESMQARRARLSRPRGIPGAIPTTGIAILAGMLCWVWLHTHAGISMTSSGTPGTATSELAEVNAQEVPAALTTMAGSDAFLSQFKTNKNDCPQPLAWISVSLLPGSPEASVRIGSGTYFSPMFNLSVVPVRIAIPYPAPYETGHGVLMVMNVGGAASVALTPPWAVPAQDGQAVRAVSWRPVESCTIPNG